MHPRAAQLIAKLDLQPHPEGGFFKEVYRSQHQVHSSGVNAVRSAFTDIYFLLTAGQVSLWHRVMHDELWNFYEGAPLRLLQLAGDFSRLHDYRLDPEGGHYKQLISAGNWQAAESAGDYSLVGCTVAPGFDFADFRLLKDLPEVAARVYHDYPDLGRFVQSGPEPR